MRGDDQARCAGRAGIIVIANRRHRQPLSLDSGAKSLNSSLGKGQRPMLCRDFIIADSSLLADPAGAESRCPASSKTPAKTTTKTV